MRFERESWRKLYVAESVSHRMLPLFTRGLRDYLLRHAEDDGTILRGSEDHASDLARVLYATVQERRQIESALDDLYRIGYLETNAGRLWIVKFAEAQSSRSPGARRQAEYRIREQCDVTGDTDDASDGDATGYVIDKTRRDESKYIRQVFDFWREAMAHPNSVLDSKRIARIRARLREGFTVEQLCQAISNAKLDDWLMGKNDRNRVYDGLETLLREAAQVERLLGLSGGNAGFIEIR